MRTLAVLAAAVVALGGAGSAAAQSAAPAVRNEPSAAQRSVFNPFAPITSSRLQIGRFGLPRFQAMRALLSQPPAAATPAAQAAPTNVTAPAAVAASGTGGDVAEVATRPPYRPPVRSPYRPPPRPPF